MDQGSDNQTTNSVKDNAKCFKGSSKVKSKYRSNRGESSNSSKCQVKPGESKCKGDRKINANSKRKSDTKTDIDKKLSKGNRKSGNKCKKDDQCSGLSFQSVSNKCNKTSENKDKKDSKEICTSADKIQVTSKTKDSENYKSVTKNRKFSPKRNIEKNKYKNKNKSSTFDRLLKSYKQKVNNMQIYNQRKNYVDSQNNLLKEDMPKKTEKGKFRKDDKSNYDPIIQPSRSDIERCKNNSRRSEQSHKSFRHKYNKKANKSPTMSFDELLKSCTEKIKSNYRKFDKEIDKSDINNEEESLDSNTQPRQSVTQTCTSTESNRCMTFDELLKVVKEKSDGDVDDDQKITLVSPTNDKQEFNVTDSSSGSQFPFDRDSETFNTNSNDTENKIDDINNEGSEIIQPNESVKEFSETNNQTHSEKSTIKCSESDKGLVKNNGLDDLGDLVRYINDDINLTVKLDVPNDFSDIPTTEPDVSTNELQSNLYLVSNSFDSSTLPILAF
ncbi:unnamed protein product, partial [Brenthis ino]